MSTKPQIFVLDIETAPNLADVWGFWGTNVGINQVWKNGRMLMWAGKYLNDRKMYSANEVDDGRKPMLKSLHKHLDNADITITQNGDKFDLRWINLEFLREDIAPPSHHVQ